MADQTVVEKFVEALTSTEALAAFLGAFAAFGLEAIRRWRADRLADLAAGNEAVFALSQMFTHASNIYHQQFVAYAQAFKEQNGHEPNYAQILPMEISSGQVPRLQLEKLGFLLRSHDPDVLNRLAVTALDFDVLMNLLDRRNTAHLEWQRESAGVFADPAVPDPVPFELLEQRIGVHRSFLLRHMTDGLKQRLPECSTNIERIGKQLTEVLTLVFPTRQVSRFERRERQDAVASPPSTAKARRWRRMVRALVKLSRTPVRIGGVG